MKTIYLYICKLGTWRLKFRSLWEGGGLWGTYPGMFQVTDKIANGVGAFCSILISMSETTHNFCTDLPDMTKPAQTYQTWQNHVCAHHGHHQEVLLLVQSMEEDDSPECVKEYKTQSKESCKHQNTTFINHSYLYLLLW